MEHHGNAASEYPIKQAKGQVPLADLALLNPHEQPEDDLSKRGQTLFGRGLGYKKQPSKQPQKHGQGKDPAVKPLNFTVFEDHKEKGGVPQADHSVPTQ